MKAVIFHLGDQEYAMDVDLLIEIITVPEITRLPKMPDFVEGTIKRRGRVIPIINLNKRLSLPETGDAINSCIFLIKHGEHIAGLLVDSANEILEIPDDIWEVEGMPAVKEASLNHYIKGTAYLGERFLIHLDIDQIMTVDDAVALPLKEAI